MNDEFVETQAGYLARRAKAEAVGAGQRSVVERLFLISVSQLPGEERMQQALSFLQERQQAGDEASALQDLAHVLLNSSEFLYMD